MRSAIATFVNDAFSMPATPNLKVFNSIVGAIAVDMVNGFVFFKTSAKRLLHDDAMLKLLFAFA